MAGLLLLVGLATACAPPAFEQMPDCGYPYRPSEQERIFVLPTIEEYVAGGTDFYTAPRRGARLHLSSIAYQRELAGRRYKPAGEVAGEDGLYQRWLLEDCRILYTPAAEKR